MGVMAVFPLTALFGVKHQMAECAVDPRRGCPEKLGVPPEGLLQTCVAQTTGLPAKLQRPIIIF